MTTEPVLYQGGPLHNRFEQVEKETLTKQFHVLTDLQPVNGPPQTRLVTYRRTKRVTPDGQRVFRVVAG